MGEIKPIRNRQSFITNNSLPMINTGFLRLVTDFAVTSLSYVHKFNWSNFMINKQSIDFK